MDWGWEGRNFFFYYLACSVVVVIVWDGAHVELSIELAASESILSLAVNVMKWCGGPFDFWR